MADWEELSGNNNWAGLLNPLEENLGETIIFYGQRVQDLYDSIDKDPNSPDYELLIIDEKEFFPNVGVNLYTMECYLNASADVMRQVDSNARDRPAPIYKSVMEQLHTAVRKLVDQYQDEEISITVAGHSLGAAVGALAAFDIVANRFNRSTGSSKECMVTLFSLASPKVGNSGFTTVFNELSNLHLLHTTHVRDIVPRLPPSIIVIRYAKFPRVELNIHVEINSTSQDNVVTSLDGVVAFSLVLSWFDVLKYPYLKNLLKAMKDQEGKSSLRFGG